MVRHSHQYQNTTLTVRWTLGLFIGTIAITMEGRRDPHNWITIVLTQWAQVGLMGIIYVFIPESPCVYSLPK